MRDLWPGLLVLTIVLLVPILPFLGFGAELEGWLAHYQEHPPTPLATALGAVLLLAGDILLPIPSSMVSTFAGWQLGWLGGTAVSWVGMSLGACLGFALARRWGRSFALWFTREQHLARVQRFAARFGPAILAFGRGVPVVAEASVLWMGIYQLSWRRFLPVVLLSNLGLSIAYAALGDLSQQLGWLPLALGVSVALPVLMALGLRWWTPPAETAAPEEERGVGTGRSGAA